MKKYLFNNKTLKESFQTKVKLARLAIKNWESEEKRVSYGGFETHGSFKEPIRNVWLNIYLGIKCKGTGKGLPIYCSIRWCDKNHPEFNGKALSKKEIETILNTALAVKLETAV